MNCCSASDWAAAARRRKCGRIALYSEDSARAECDFVRARRHEFQRTSLWIVLSFLGMKVVCREDLAVASKSTTLKTRGSRARVHIITVRLCNFQL
jgi:hypothetical protein